MKFADALNGLIAKLERRSAAAGACVICEHVLPEHEPDCELDALVTLQGLITSQ